MTGPDIIDLTAPPGPGAGFLGASLIPARGLMLLQARARLADGREVAVIHAPARSALPGLLDGGAADFQGNASFSFGGAVLAPFANRIRGRFDPATRSIEAMVAGRALRLPANGGGKAPGAEQYAIHGRILATPVSAMQVQPASASGVIEAGDFGVGWPSSTRLTIVWTLSTAALGLRVEARNVGTQPTPIGLGWHPYFALPSGLRDQARLRLPAGARLPVNDYDEVLPTGQVLPVAGTDFDFRAGVALGDRYLDDCFTELARDAAGQVVCEVTDPAASYGLRITSASPHIQAIQTFTAPGRAFVVVEPQFNLANPYGAEWGGRETGMVLLPPGGAASYDATLTLFTP